MTTHEHAVPMRAPFWTNGTRVLGLLAGLGIAVYLYRLIAGLGAVTNLDDQYPWGIWISIDVASGVALAAGGFTTAALAHIFHREKYHALVRPALLTAMLGYTFVVIGLLADLGR
ncbi:MAG TPA: Ni/Fe-hydrogenase cytochrome b subunit, partial [Acidobacteriota bacterium]|nr:Ni/Fe-hydrogenase cytochrome b subunit [Acidobacteriota bacterium]